MQEFYTNTIESRFIKSLLANTYIPTVQVWKPGIKLVKGFIYITKNYILKALKDFPNVSDSTVGPRTETDNTYFKIIDTYIFGKFYKGITSNFISNNSLYDSETHYYLGEYLRAYRDLFDIDLMPYYNCWGGQYSDKIRLTKTFVEETSSYKYGLRKDNLLYDDGLKTLLVPIKFNQLYTIYIDSNSSVKFYLAYCEGDVVIGEINNTALLNQLKKTNKDYISFEEAGLSFNNPKLFKIDINSSDSDNENSEAGFYKDYLTLIIQLPEINTSNVLVLEGDYKDIKVLNINNENNRVKRMIYDSNQFKYATTNDLKKYFSNSVPKLTQTFSGRNYAFSNRLIEYLLLNVISENDTISNNIEEIQNYIQSSDNKRINNSIYNGPPLIKGIWDNNLRKYIYDEVTTRTFAKNKINGTVFDVNGFLDKDSESIIMRGNV